LTCGHFNKRYNYVFMNIVKMIISVVVTVVRAHNVTKILSILYCFIADNIIIVRQNSTLVGRKMFIYDYFGFITEHVFFFYFVFFSGQVYCSFYHVAIIIRFPINHGNIYGCCSSKGDQLLLIISNRQILYIIDYSIVWLMIIGSRYDNVLLNL